MVGHNIVWVCVECANRLANLECEQPKLDDGRILRERAEGMSAMVREMCELGRGPPISDLVSACNTPCSLQCVILTRSHLAPYKVLFAIVVRLFGLLSLEREIDRGLSRGDKSSPGLARAWRTPLFLSFPLEAV